MTIFDDGSRGDQKGGRGAGMRVARVVAALSVMTIALLSAGQSAAYAHVTALAPDAVPGSNSVVTLRVPTESATAGTVRLEVTLPPEYPLAVVRNAATPGWDVTLHKTTLASPIDNGHGGTVVEAVSSVTFAAKEGIAIAPGEFGEFRLLLGPLPDSASLVLPTVQTYSDGTVVSWIEQSSDGTEPDKPAPVVTLTGAGGGHSGHDGSGSGAVLPVASVELSAPHSDSTPWVSWVALVVALGALVSSGSLFVRGVRSK